MAIDLVKSREEVLSPSAPCIIKNLAQVEGGVIIQVPTCDANYPYGVIKDYEGNYHPKVLKAGHLISVESYADDSYFHAQFIEDGVFTGLNDVMDYTPTSIGVLTHDAAVFMEDEIDTFCVGAVMTIGVVDASQLPAKVSPEQWKKDVALALSNGIILQNVHFEA